MTAKTKETVTLTLECGHTRPGLGRPSKGEEAMCWGWGCLRFRPIIKVEVLAH